MKEFLENFFFPSVKIVLPLNHPPFEVMRRISKGVDAQNAKETRKPFKGQFEKLKFQFQEKQRHDQEWAPIVTSGQINLDANRIEIITEFDEWQLLFMYIIFLGVGGYSFIKEFHSTGLMGAFKINVGILFGVLVFILSLMHLIVKACSKQHVKFIQEALAWDKSFELAQYQKNQFINRFLILLMGLIGAIAVTFAFFYYVLPRIEGRVSLDTVAVVC